VWLTDESKFNLFGSDGKKYCRRRDREAMVDRNLQKTIKHGSGSVMVWACISWNRPGCIHLVDGKMNAAQYCSILSTSLLGSFEDENLGPQDIIFNRIMIQNTHHNMLDNGSRITASMSPLDTQSLDMNIIEPAWGALETHI
jgi:hypothetical protein